VICDDLLDGSGNGMNEHLAGMFLSLNADSISDDDNHSMCDNGADNPEHFANEAQILMGSSGGIR
jgi:hypothetical protein